MDDGFTDSSRLSVCLGAIRHIRYAVSGLYRMCLQKFSGGSMSKIRTAVVVVAGLLAASTLRAQNTNSGDIRGVVTDSTGAVVPDATVTVLDNDKGVTT